MHPASRPAARKRSAAKRVAKSGPCLKCVEGSGKKAGHCGRHLVHLGSENAALRHKAADPAETDGPGTDAAAPAAGAGASSPWGVGRAGRLEEQVGPGGQEQEPEPEPERDPAAAAAELALALDSVLAASKGLQCLVRATHHPPP